MNERAKIVLKSGKDQSLRRYHPWVFSGAIKKTYGNLIEGEVVNVFDNKDEFLGAGHYSPGSIAVRVLTFNPDVEINNDFFRNKIKNAYHLRVETNTAFRENHNIFRLVHAEGDGLPGLIIDVYNDTAVIQCHSVGMWKNRLLISEILKEVLGENLKAVYDKSSDSVPRNAPVDVIESYLYGKSEGDFALENGLKFKIDWAHGQKTGFFIDQRENRKLLEYYSKDRSVLNMFCYTGGFSVYAMRGGATKVASVDSSARAIDLTDKNIEANFPADERHVSYAEDAFKFLERDGDKYDVIILDPPAFAKHKNVLNNALQGYKRLNLKALEKIKPGGIIFTFSCSQVVSKENFRKSVFAAAANTGRFVRILHQLDQPCDHPVNIYHPESEYLKGLVIQVY